MLEVVTNNHYLRVVIAGFFLKFCRNEIVNLEKTFYNYVYIQRKQRQYSQYHNSRDRIVVSTLRCGRSNPGSNPGHGSVHSLYRQW